MRIWTHSQTPKYIQHRDEPTENIPVAASSYDNFQLCKKIGCPSLLSFGEETSEHQKTLPPKLLLSSSQNTRDPSDHQEAI